MRAPTSLALVLALASCGEPATQPFAASAAAAFARGDSHRAALAVYTAQLRAEDELPSPTTSKAWGFTQVKVKPGGVIEWTVRVHNPAGESFRAGDIHVVTGADPTGPVALGLFAGTHAEKQFELRGTASNAALANALLTNPAAYSIDLHTVEFPAGALRGSLP